LLALSPQIEIVGEARDGQESVQLVAERHPDVVLMDLQMPVMDGLEATRYIKSQWPEVRVVTLTMSPGYRLAAYAAGADAFLLKGCRVDALRAAITLEPNSDHCRHGIRMRDELANDQMIKGEKR
jgi:DNA-binding NarL/FixJ family response regulator